MREVPGMASGEGALGDPRRPLTRRIAEYDTQACDFRSWAELALGVEDLARLHASASFGPVLPNDRSLSAAWSRAFEESLPSFLVLFERLLETELPRHFPSGPKVRHTPRFRVHPPGWASISPFHKDSQYGLSPGAINVWVPLTSVWDSNALWIESATEPEVFEPVAMRYGQALLFDAVRLTHGSRENRTGSTRVSFDFRCHPDP